MSALQRNKGKAGEREAAAIVRDLTGCDVQQRVRHQDGDAGLVGVPGWAFEVERHRRATRGEMARGRAAWPPAEPSRLRYVGVWRDHVWTAYTSLRGWTAVVVGFLPFGICPAESRVTRRDVGRAERFGRTT